LAAENGGSNIQELRGERNSMTPTAPSPLTRQQLINLLSQYKQEWQHLYGIQNITLFGSLARDESTASSDALVHFREVERDAVSI
jgi:hypothetical protein